MQLVRGGVVDAGVEERHDPVMAEARQPADLGLVVGPLTASRKRRAEEFQRDVAIQDLVVGAVDGGHAPSTDRIHRAVSTAHEDVGPLRSRIAHPTPLEGDRK